jgi:hypothetical protein
MSDSQDIIALFLEFRFDIQPTCLRGQCPMIRKHLYLAGFTILIVAFTALAHAEMTVSSDKDEARARSAQVGPITITSGGTYTGKWVSTDPNTPAITIATSEPVIIQNSTIVSKGDLISVKGIGNGANLTVQNVTGTGLDPGVAGKQRGKFLFAYKAKAISVTHCTMNGVSFGVYIEGSVLTGLSITNNAANDMEDRASDGRGGLVNKVPSLGHFVIIAKSVAVNGGDISWNQVIDTPGKSSVTDVINIFLSHGRSKSDSIRIHDNYLQGMSSPANTNNNYTGSGIMMDGPSDDLQTATGFVTISDNQIVHTANAGIGIDAGHDISATNNSIVSCGKDSSGSWIATTSALAVVMWNTYHSKVFFNNSISGTSGGLVRPDKSGKGETADTWTPDASATAGNVAGRQTFADPCIAGGNKTLAPELVEHDKWIEKLNAASQTVGASIN